MRRTISRLVRRLVSGRAAARGLASTHQLVLGFARQLERAEQPVEGPPQPAELVVAARLQALGDVGRPRDVLDGRGEVVERADRGPGGEPAEQRREGQRRQRDEQQRQAEVAELVVDPREGSRHLQRPAGRGERSRLRSPEAAKVHVLAVLLAARPSRRCSRRASGRRPPPAPAAVTGRTGSAGGAARPHRTARSGAGDVRLISAGGRVDGSATAANRIDSTSLRSAAGCRSPS